MPGDTTSLTVNVDGRDARVLLDLLDAPALLADGNAW